MNGYDITPSYISPARRTTTIVISALRKILTISYTRHTTNAEVSALLGLTIAHVGIKTRVF